MTYQQYHTLVHRDVQASKSQIVEEVYWDDNPTQASRFISTLARNGDTNAFTVTDDAMTYVGTIEYTSGEEWYWDSWTYDIPFNDGSGTLVGTATTNAQGGFDTDKQFLLPDGSVQVNIAEHALPITVEQFDARKTAAVPWNDSI